MPEDANPLEHDVPSLIADAVGFLHGMQREDGLFCLERVRGDAAPRGRSVRYSLMTYIGLAKAERSGLEHGFDLDAIRAALWSELDSPELDPGDFGLYLWADAVRGPAAEGADLAGRAERAFAAAGGLQAHEGQEVSWLAIGLSHHPATREASLRRAALDELLGRLEPATGLLYHYGGSHPRRRFANFATESYSTLALAIAAKDGDETARSAARGVADRLIALQRADGGWPWLYDVRRGGVVEPYEVYSVHQHAMAPMALLQLAEASGDPRYEEAARRGLRWIDGRNELGLDMVDEGEQLIYRSIRRRRPLDRVVLYGNTAAAYVFGHGLSLAGRGIELNATCRPYELGWLLEAWCGR
ncbi:MAG TPA: hypothetical protein VLU96_12115 [Gaiellaceae bacterium]|nr:hypothetical protein [Gaiellaceae bacterium]